MLITAAEALERRFFTRGSGHTAAVLRTGYASLLLYDTIDFLFVRGFFLGPEGVCPRLEMQGVTDLYGFASTYATSAGFEVARILAAVSLLAGFFSRTSAAISLVLQFLAMYRCSPATFGGDTLLFNLGLWMPFLSSGQVWSLDRLLTQGARTRTIATWPVQGIKIQMCALYLNSGIFKALAPEWRSGTALLEAIEHRGLSWTLDSFLFREPLASAVLGYVAVATELSFPLLICFRKTRLLALGLAVGLHLGIESMLSIHLFSYIAFWGLLAFVPDEVTAVLWQRATARVKWPRLRAIRRKTLPSQVRS